MNDRRADNGSEREGGKYMRIAGFDILELAGGLIIFAGGTAVAIGATTYEIGALTRMGPGYFPLVVGITFALMGLGLVFTSRTTNSSLPVLQFKPAFAIFAGLIFWGLTIERFGIVPAILGLVVLVSLAQKKPSFVMIGATALFLIAFTIVVFIYALGVPIPAFKF